MDNSEFKRVFDQVKPSAEQEQTMLDRLLAEQKEVKPMRYMKKMTAVMAAAALLLMACAFTVATGLDQRILAYFGGSQEDAQLLAPGFMAVDLTSAAENGGTVHISQIYSDHRSVVIVGEMTVPDGNVLDQDSYRFDDWQLCPKGADGTEPDGGYGSYGTYGGAEIWTDDAPGDNTISFLLAYLYTAGNFEPDTAELTFARDIECFELTLGNLKGCAEGDVWSSAPVLVPGEWTFEIPLSGKDFGWTVTPQQTIELNGETITVEEIYLSPVGLSVRLANESGNLADLVKAWEESSATAWSSSVALQDQNGLTIPGSVPYSHTSPYTGEMLFTFDKIYNPDRFQGGIVTIMGQDFSLDGLKPAVDETTAS